MTELVDMKLPKQKNESMKDTCAPCSLEQPKYPWGLQIRLEKEQIDKLPVLKEVKVGDSVLVYAEATVTEVRIAERQNGKEDHTVELQIEKVGCEVEKPLAKMSMKEYRAARGK